MLRRIMVMLVLFALILGITASAPLPQVLVQPAPTSTVALFEDITPAPFVPDITTEETTAPAASEWHYSTSTVQATVTRHERERFVYFAVDITIAEADQFSTAFARERFGGAAEPLSDIAERHNPVLAINGDYYGFHANGIIVRNGVLYRAKSTTRQMLVVNKNGDLGIITDRTERAQSVADRLIAEGVLQTFEFGPALVVDGMAVPLASDILKTGDEYREPRTAIGQLGPLHYLVLIVDGRSPGYSDGCNFRELQALFLEHGASDAFNLDGGGSTTLWFNGDILNRPSAGEERKISDILMFTRD